VSPRGVATYSAYSADRAGQPATASAASTVLTPSESMRIERAGSQRWLVVGGYASFPCFERVQLQACGALSRAPWRATAN